MGARLSLRVSVLTLLTILCGLAVPASADVTAFIYHRFGDSRYPSTNISGEDFASHLAWLEREGRAVLSLGEVVRRLREGERLPAGAVVLTVDDAYQSFLETGMPLLRRSGFPVTLFVNTDAVGAPGYLGWDELRDLAAEGVEIGNHSATHDYLLERRAGEDEKAWEKRVREDILRAQKALEEKLGKAPTLFAYPFGEYSPALEDLVADLGFAGAVGQQSGAIAAEGHKVDLYTLPRFPMGGGYAGLDSFRTKARMHSMPVRVLEPASPVLTDGTSPPRLRFQLEDGRVRTEQLQCFVQGENTCRVEVVAGRDGEYLVVAEKPLSGRRNKYTVTAPGSGGGWYWFSQPWFLPGRPGDGY